MFQLEHSIPGLVDVFQTKRIDISQSLVSDLSVSEGDSNKVLLSLLPKGLSADVEAHPPAELVSPFDELHGSFEALSEHIKFRQGLRTGCDKAHYCSINNIEDYTTSSDQDDVEVAFTKPLNLEIRIPKRYVKRCVKGQHEDPSKSNTGVVIPGKSVTRDDFGLMEKTYPKKIEAWKNQGLHVMPNGLEAWVSRVEATNFGSVEVPKMILDYVVQKSNGNQVGLGEKLPDDVSERDFPSWWYTLNLQPRHVSPLYFPRINSGKGGNMYASHDPGNFVISANFTTLDIQEVIEPSTIIKLLETEWLKTHLEISCAPMGGGALKIEKAHFQRLVIPQIDLTKRFDGAEEIDMLFAKSLGIDYSLYVSKLKLMKESFRNMRK